MAAHGLFACEADNVFSLLFQVNSLYSGDSGLVTVNAMNAPNNSTLQASGGTKNILNHYFYLSIFSVGVRTLTVLSATRCCPFR